MDQILKDLEQLNSGQVRSLSWEFGINPDIGFRGPNAALATVLKSHVTKVVVNQAFQTCRDIIR